MAREHFSVLLSESERAVWATLAGAEHLSLGAWIRAACRDRASRVASVPVSASAGMPGALDVVGPPPRPETRVFHRPPVQAGTAAIAAVLLDKEAAVTGKSPWSSSGGLRQAPKEPPGVHPVTAWMGKIAGDILLGKPSEGAPADAFSRQYQAVPPWWMTARRKGDTSPSVDLGHRREGLKGVELTEAVLAAPKVTVEMRDGQVLMLSTEEAGDLVDQGSPGVKDSALLKAVWTARTLG